MHVVMEPLLYIVRLVNSKHNWSFGDLRKRGLGVCGALRCGVCAGVAQKGEGIERESSFYLYKVDVT